MHKTLSESEITLWYLANQGLYTAHYEGIQAIHQMGPVWPAYPSPGPFLQFCRSEPEKLSFKVRMYSPIILMR